MKTRTRVALILAGPALLLGVSLYADRDWQHRMPPPAPPLPLTVPHPALPLCADVAFGIADYRLLAAAARLSGYEAEARMWDDVIAQEEARRCTGPRWEVSQ